MISRRSMLIGSGAILSFAGVAGGHRISSVAANIRAPILYAFGPYEFASRIQHLSGQVLGEGLFNTNLLNAENPSRSVEPLINREIHVRELSDPSSRTVTTPNNDTLYTSAVLDLAVSPVEVIAPDAQERYVSIAFMDLFNDQVAYIGTRATDGRGGRFWVIGPGHSPDIPDGVTPIKVDSNDLWMLGRVFVAGAQDLEAARAVQSQISVTPLNPAATARPFLTQPTTRPDAENFLALTNEILGRNSSAKHTARAVEFGDFGISPGETNTFERLSPLKKIVWTRAVEQVEDKISAEIAALAKIKKGWTTPPLILGKFGNNDAIRAGTALSGFGALTADEAVYFRSATDAEGAPLNGNRSYEMVIPEVGVPTDAFWSLSMYTVSPEGRLYFYENDLNRYAINSYDQGLRRQSDGSIILALQRTQPSDPSRVWMPTPDGLFNCIFRTYLPGPEILKGLWMPPLIIRK